MDFSIMIKATFDLLFLSHLTANPLGRHGGGWESSSHERSETDVADPSSTSMVADEKVADCNDPRDPQKNTNCVDHMSLDRSTTC
jgi:hypothetical protein